LPFGLRLRSGVPADDEALDVIDTRFSERFRQLGPQILG
jgi:hypothetical protein